MFTSDQVRDIIAKYHDFHEMVDFFKKYDQLFETDFKSSVSWSQSQNRESILEQPDSCFVSHSRWTNASTHDNFQRKNWANYPWFKHPSCFYWQNKKRLGWVMTWWRFGLKKFGLNILKLIVIGLDMKIHCYHLMISLHIRLMESKLNYWKVILVVPRNANQWMLTLTNHSKPYWKGVG